jgi:hypothetical protein
MMKFQAYLFFFTILLQTVHAADVNMACSTELPSTTVNAQTNNGIVTIDLIHNIGVKFMPIHMGIITPDDLGMLSDRASLLADLGDHLSFDLPSSACQVTGLLIYCFGNSEVKIINGHKVNLWAAYTSQYDEVTINGVYSYVTTDLAIEVDGESIHLPMKYSKDECSSGLVKLH